MIRNDKQRIAGVILAGGQSSRMFAGGTGDKALLSLGGELVLSHVIRRVTPQTSRLILNANGDRSRFQTFGLEIVSDSVPDHPGPLAGILSGLRSAANADPGATHSLTVPCDGPFLPLDLVERLQAALTCPDQIVLAASSSGQHYVTGLWPLGIADQMQRDLQSGQAKVGAWVKANGATFVTFQDHECDGRAMDPFFNINTKDDLAVAEAWVACTARQKSKLFGIVGWKNSGKTTLTLKVIAALTDLGYKVATVKCSHHEFDGGGADLRQHDTELHRAAGAVATAFLGRDSFGIVASDGTLRPRLIPSGNRMHDLTLLIEGLSAADVVLVEGFKTAAFAKIEVRSAAASDQCRLSDDDTHIVAVASDNPRAGSSPTEFSRDNAVAIAEVIVKTLGLNVRTTPS